FHCFHSLDLRQTARYGLVPPLAPQSLLRAFAPSLFVLMLAPVWFLLVPISILAYVLSNLWYYDARPCSSWSPFGLLRLALGPTVGAKMFRLIFYGIETLTFSMCSPCL
ncbi:hypothetical protein V8G54_002926, partial [Vigna mungo]